MKSPSYKTVEALHEFMETRGACEDGLDFIKSCTTLEQAYSCTTKGFWYFAIERDVDLFYAVPQEVKAKWNSYDWRCLVEAHPRLKEFSPYHN